MPDKNKKNQSLYDNNPYAISGIDPEKIRDIEGLKLINQTILDTEGGETKWPKKPIIAPVETPLAGLGKESGPGFISKERPIRDGRGTGRGVRRGSGKFGDPISTGQQVSKTRDLSLGDASLPSFQRTYDYYRNLEDLDKFTFDDTYDPDNQGFRDIAGYLMDAGKTALGAFGATEPLDPYTLSSDFQLMRDEARLRRDTGLTQEARSEMTDRMERAYAYDVKNIRSLSGGSGATALANLGGASDRYYSAQLGLNELDENIRAMNRDRFTSSALAGEQAERQIWEDERQIDLMNKTAAGQLMADSMENIRQRKEYEDTYLDPSSPYYQLRKEMTLDTRQNRELKEFAEQQRLKDADRYLLDVENQMQEEVNRIDFGKRAAIDDFNKAALESGYAPIVNSADDFNNYKGQPIVNIDAPLQNDFSDVSDQKVFGLTRTEMDKMSDEQLSERGIDRTTSETSYVDQAGNRIPVTTRNYGIAQAMDEVKAPSKNDIAYNRIQDDVNLEYSSKEKELRDKYYLSDEKEYNKQLEALRKEKQAEIEKRQTEYLNK